MTSRIQVGQQVAATAVTASQTSIPEMLFEFDLILHGIRQAPARESPAG
jgi:hypothetical protein